MYALTQEILKPFPLLMVLTGGLLLLARRRCPEPRRLWRLLLLSYGLLLLDSLPLTASLTAGWLERSFPRVTSRPEGTRVIVVLGGGVIQPLRVGEPTLPDYSTFTRTYRAWELYRDGPPCTILVTGGEPDPRAPGEPAAAVMAELLRKAGVAESDILVEDQSRTTAENAAYSVQMLRDRELTQGVLLVSTATHLWRAERLFRRRGQPVTPVGCDYFADQIPWSWGLFWPSGTAVSINQHAWHEFLGTAWYWLRDL